MFKKLDSLITRLSERTSKDKLGSAMLRWWVLACTFFVSTAWMQHKGLFSYLWFADASMMSFVALGVFSTASVFVGLLTYRSSKHDLNPQHLQAAWYASELLMAIGMVGTLVGFLLMLGPSLSNLSSSDVEVAKGGIFSMAMGMSTSVIATLVGLVTSQLLKLQLVSLEVSLKD